MIYVVIGCFNMKIVYKDYVDTDLAYRPHAPHAKRNSERLKVSKIGSMPISMPKSKSSKNIVDPLNR